MLALLVCHDPVMYRLTIGSVDDIAEEIRERHLETIPAGRFDFWVTPSLGDSFTASGGIGQLMVPSRIRKTIEEIEEHVPDRIKPLIMAPAYRALAVVRPSVLPTCTAVAHGCR